MGCAARETKFCLVFLKVEDPASLLVPRIPPPCYLIPPQDPSVEMLGQYLLTVARGWPANDAHW